MRLNAYLARTGIASRRGADELIKTGRVRVNGVYARAEHVRRRSATWSTSTGGSSLPQALAYVLLHKPAGVVTTASDPHGRPTVVELVEHESRVVPVGRLDADTTGVAPAHERRRARAPARAPALRGREGLRGRGRGRAVGRSARRARSAASSSTTARPRRHSAAGSARHASSLRSTRAASTRSSACSKRSATR